MKKQAGFTLIELMVTVGIAAVLAILAAPAIGQSLSNQQVKQAAFELAQTLATARSNAVLYRRAIIVRSSYLGTPNRNWSGSTGLYDDKVPTSQLPLLAGTSWYILETGTNTTISSASDNRVSVVSTINSAVGVNNNSAIAIQFMPDSSIQIESSKNAGFSTTAQTQVFTICSDKTSARISTARSVSVNRFGNVTVNEKASGVTCP
jgi:prepilin-type N-terminal cleavage/methylation domain-containing protein